MHNYLIASSILSANFAKLGEDINKVISAGADIIHFDAMDNHYVPNLTIGPIVLKSLRNYGITIPIDVHLMAKPVDKLIQDFAFAGANYITFHPETSENINYSIQLIKKYGCKAGLAFSPNTSLNYLNNILDKIDIILIMSVNPGFSNQSFLPSTLEKIYQVHKIINFNNKNNILLEVDGGIKINNIRIIASLGVNIFVIGSDIFEKSDYNSIIYSIRNELNKKI